MIGPQWLESIREVSGLDPLGVQAISINIYGYLLPGMTNVTNRLRYYTFLCWVLSNYSKKIRSGSLEDWQSYLRKSEFLFALVTDMHHIDEKGYSSSVVGSRITGPLIRKDQREVINLKEYTQFDESPKRYWQNRGGGFAQYYQGPMKEMKLIVDGGPLRLQLADDVVESKEIRFGLKAANIFDLNPKLDLFHKCVTEGKVTRDQLKAMSESLCACRIDNNKDEQGLLKNLLFDLKNNYSNAGFRRRKTLTLVLNFIKNDNNKGLSVDDFRNICMYTHYPNGKKIKIEKDSLEIFEWWNIYQMHEYFAFALQCLLYVFERMTDKKNNEFDKIFLEIQKEVSKTPVGKILPAFKNIDFKENTSLSKFINKISPSNNDDEHWLANGMSEYCLTEKFYQLIKEDNIGLMICIAVIILTKIYSKTAKQQNIYKNLDVDFVTNYQITIFRLNNAIKKIVGKDDDLWSFIYMLIKEFVVDWHVVVALRKFRYDKKSTLRFALENNKYTRTQRIRYDEPVFTSPRLVPAFRFLEDLDLLKEIENNKYILTKEGLSFLEKLNEL